jgi:polyisoprenoid-binding protein YceI
MKRLLATAVPILFLATAPTLAQPVDYAFDKSHTQISAQWEHQGYSTQSLHLTDYSATLSLDMETPANSTVDVTFNLIDGIWPGAHHDRFITHLNSDDFFETEVNPTARFVGTGFETEDGTVGIMTGDLTMNGQTHSVSLEVTLNKSGETQDGSSKLGFTATGTVVRSQWDMGFAIPWIPDEIEIFISTEMVAVAAE